VFLVPSRGMPCPPACVAPPQTQTVLYQVFDACSVINTATQGRPPFLHNHVLIELPYINSYRKACNFSSKLHAFCSLRDVRNFTLSKRPRRALPNQVKSTLATSVHVLATPLLHWQQLKMARCAERSHRLSLGLFLFLSRRNAVRTE